jgi:putative hemolysin
VGNAVTHNSIAASSNGASDVHISVQRKTTMTTNRLGITALGSAARTTLVAAITSAVAIVTASTAYALTPEQIQGYCSAHFGTYSTFTDKNGRTVSLCCYPDEHQCESWTDGLYDGYVPNKVGPPVSRPAVPPGNHAPIQTSPPPAAH